MSLERRAIRGISAAPGVAVGPVTVFDRRAVPIPRRRLRAERIEEEVARLERGLDAARAEVERIRDSLTESARPDHRLLLETQLMMHRDALLKDEASRRIRELRINAEWALRKTIDELGDTLRAAPEPYFRERADDIAHVGEDVLRALTGATSSLPTLDEPTILVACDLSPAEAAQLSADKLLAVVTDTGTASSHTAILARALGVPALVGVRDVTRAVGPGETMIADALRGEVVVFPTEAERQDAEARSRRFAAFEGRLRESEPSAAQTVDGVRVGLFANVELELDASAVMAAGADGVGLYRTEFLYLHRAEVPSEEEQVAVYRRVAARVAPKTVVFRTFDLGADKMPTGMRRGPNPALGLRALRVAFEQPELLVTQLRAILRASSAGNVRVMFPMVSSLSDLRRAKVLLERARADLDAEGTPYGPVAVGAMLEVPSAVLVADLLAEHCDFFSIGTNDLTQYTLAVDRSDPRVAHFASSIDPAVLRSIHRARTVAEESEIDISVCGDVAADPVATALLVGLGFDRLSMPVSAIPLIREVVGRLERAHAREVAVQALRCGSTAAVERLVAAEFGEALGELWDAQGIELPR